MIGGLFALVLACAVFLGTHVALSSTGLRGTLRDQVGERGFLALYSSIAFVSLAWMVLAYAHAPYVELWAPVRALRFVPVVVMPFAAILLIGGLTAKNPTAVGQERAAADDDPAPGMLRVTRHPVMWAIGLWALAHIPPNGDLASLIFFGALAALALGGTLLIDAKKRLALGSNWARLADITSNLPFAAVLAGRTRLRPHEIGILRVVAGLLLYAVLAYAHPLFAGVSVVD